MNFIPKNAYDTGNYFCTWKTQAVVCRNKNLKNIKRNVRDSLGEELLFGEVGILHLIPKEVRKDLIVVIDDGWDVPYGLDPNDPTKKDGLYFGSLCLNEERFPSFKGSPKERLKALSDKVKSLGYVGLGLWISPQEPFKEASEYVFEESEAYWIERLEWCHDADIKYWKIDWGMMDGQRPYRKMIHDHAKTYAPHLKIEQACVQDPLDATAKERQSEAYRQRLDKLRFLEANGDYLRTYDVLSQFFFTTSVNRTVEAFIAAEQAEIKGHSIVSVEDCLYLGAALGCSLGVMRLYQLETDPAYDYHPPMQKPYNELKRALRWQRLAPPFAIDESDFVTDKTMYADSFPFPDKPDPKPWPKEVWGKTVVQHSYAGMSRNMPLAKIEACGEKPYVVSARNPRTGAVSVFASPRTLDGSIMHSIRADIAIEAENSDCPIGIFGHYNSLTVSFKDTVFGKRVFAQDLAADECMDITDRVAFVGEHKIKLEGTLIDEIGLSEKECETELPGLVVRLR